MNEPPPPEPVNVLAVDDTPENLVALARLLDRPGLNLIEARSGDEALEALLAQDVALALLDVHMPGMDGFELAELMRGSERTRHVPIIFLTASGRERSRMFQGYEAGAVDYLVKPLDSRLLVSKVEVFAQLHRQRRLLARQLEQIQRAQGMSDLFLGVLGHDLRNPLSTVVTGAALLERRADDPELTRRKAATIQRAAWRMERLIQQLLDFAQARVRGGIPVHPVAADLVAIVQQALAELEGPAAQRIHTRMTGDCAGLWDADRLMQVVSNLIGNALEHGDGEGRIDVELDGGAPAEVRLQVSNRGVIPHATREVLFDPFKPPAMRARGTGLGLYIVDQIVRAHRGRIEVASDEDSGTRVQVRLPR